VRLRAGIALLLSCTSVVFFAQTFIAGALFAQTPTTQAPKRIVRPGVKAVQSPLASVRPSATFKLGGHPDWMLITADAVWVANDQLKAVQRIDPATNKLVATIQFAAEPCSGLAVGFGSLWVPLCGEPASLARIDPATNRITATLPIGPADSEGGITASDDSIWLVTDKNGTLARIDPTTNSIRTKIGVPAGSFNPLFSGGVVWITGTASNVLTAVGAASDKVIGSVPVGPQPRFLAAGSGSIWTLNQGDGTVSRVKAKTRRVTATIKAGIPGPGGEICFSVGSVWATVFDVPLTRIDPKTNKVVQQWVGRGGDSVRFGFGSIWLTDYKRGLLWRIPLARLRKR
jgi:DNA-binding beta-propeller fold protein YncE